MRVSGGMLDCKCDGDSEYISTRFSRYDTVIQSGPPNWGTHSDESQLSCINWAFLCEFVHLTEEEMYLCTIFNK